MTLLAVVLAAALGCATSRVSGKDLVTLTGEPGPECSYIATVTGANPWGSQLDTRQEETNWAREEAADRAALLGATHVKYEPEPVAGKATVKAYRCESASAQGSSPATAAPPAAPFAGGCTKDVDCKGERICEAGRCVDAPPRPR